jgi:Tol biopolymer transport system component
MTERWKSQLELLDRLYTKADLLDPAQERPRPAVPPTPPAQRLGAIVVASVLTVGLAIGAYVLLDRRPTRSDLVATPPAVVMNGDLLYTANRENAWHIYAVDPDTGEERELSDGVRDYGSDWSPDGTKIVYDSEDGGGYGIVIANADGSDPVRIADGESPTWSPDGARIAYVHEGQIWIANVDGSEAHPITDGPDATGQTVSFEAGYDWNPDWSPDGQAIVYTRVVSERLVPMPNGNGRTSVTLEELRVWRQDGTDLALTDEYTHLGGPDWSPDGSTIVFSGAPTLYDEEETKGMSWPRLLTVPAGGGEITPITPERERWIAGGTWSPDGKWIAYQDDYETISIIRPDGSARREIPLGYEVIGLSWGVAPS